MCVDDALGEKIAHPSHLRLLFSSDLLYLLRQCLALPLVIHVQYILHPLYMYNVLVFLHVHVICVCMCVCMYVCNTWVYG